VKRLHQQALGSRFKVKKAHRPQGHAPAWIKAEEKALLRRFPIEFMLKDPENLGRDVLELGLPFVPDSTASYYLVSKLPFDVMKHKPPLRRQRMMGGSGNLGPGEPFIIPGDNVARVGDVESGLIIPARNVPRGSDFEKLRVERPSIQDKG